MSDLSFLGSGRAIIMGLYYSIVLFSSVDVVGRTIGRRSHRTHTTAVIITLVPWSTE